MAGVIHAALEGILTGLYPIGLVIVSALFTYALTIETKGFATIRQGLSKISDDKRVMALLIVWGFGNFMEGMAGFGTAVAIPAAMLVGLGFDPLRAVLCCLVANTVPTAFGSVGVPTMVLAGESGCPPGPLSYAIARLELVHMALTPFLVLLAADGLRGLRERWGMALLASGAFLLPWLTMAQVGCELPDVVGGLSVMIVIGLCGRWRELGLREQLRAWTPFLFVIVLLAIGAALPADRKVSPGVLILVAALAAGLVQRVPFVRLLKILWATVVSYKKALTIICSVLAVAKVLGELGVIRMIADALIAVSGEAYPAFAPAVGALGGFITGSGTSSNVLFGQLQASVAGSEARALWYAAANVMGAGIGKMICPQSIVLGCAAAGLVDGERTVLRRALVYFVPVLAAACVITFVSVRFVI